MLIDGENTGPEGPASAPGENAEVIRVLQVLSEHDVADIEEGGQLRDRGVPDAPRVLELVRDASVQDEAPPRRRGLIDRTEGLNKEGERAVAGNHLHDALPDPRGELGTKGDLGRLVALPASMVWPARGAQGEAGLGHVKTALNHRGGGGIEGAEAAMPGSRSIINRHDIAVRKLVQLKIRRHEAGGKRRPTGRLDKPGGGRRSWAGEQ
jgi:hypothetical protein